MVTIFLALLFICSKTIAGDLPYFAITPEREQLLKNLDKNLNPLLTCFEHEKNKGSECDRIISLFSDPIRYYHAKISWQKWEHQNRFCTLPIDTSFEKQEQAEDAYHDSLHHSFKNLNRMYPFIEQACSDKSVEKTIKWYIFQTFKNATEQKAQNILEKEWLLNPLKEDLCSFKNALERAAQTPKGKELIAKQTKKQRDTLEKIQQGTRDGWEALNHDNSIGELLADLAMLDPVSKEFYEKHVLDNPKYNFEPIHNIVTPIFTKYNIGTIRKIYDSWMIVPLSNDHSSNLATLNSDGSLEPCLDI